MQPPGPPTRPRNSEKFALASSGRCWMYINPSSKRSHQSVSCLHFYQQFILQLHIIRGTMSDIAKILLGIVTSSLAKSPHSKMTHALAISNCPRAFQLTTGDRVGNITSPQSLEDGEINKTNNKENCKGAH